MEIQTFVDELARLIKRPITVEDTDGNLIAYSAHEQPVDAVRMETLLRKGASKTTIDVLKKHGVYEAVDSSSGVVRVKAIPEIGFDSRIAVAIRSGRKVIGYLWVKDGGGPLLPQDEAAIIKMSRLLSQHLPGTEPAFSSSAPQAGSLVMELISPVGKIDPAEFTARSRGWDLNPPFQVIVLAGKPLGRPVNVAALREQVSPFFSDRKLNALISDYHDQVVIVVIGEPSYQVKGIALGLSRYLEDAGFRRFIGLGCSCADLTMVHRSYNEACEAISLGTKLHLDDEEPFLDYGQVALYDLVKCLSRCKAQGAYGRDLVRHIALFDRLNGTDLMKTLEAWLDYGGRRKDTARYLNIHPNTLDYRLRRIGQVIQCPLDDPGMRLAVHLWIKAARFSEQDGGPGGLD